MSSERWRGAFDAGARAWPGVELSFEQFQVYWKDRDEHEIADAERAADLYLACACAGANPAALVAFEREMLAPAEASIARIRREPEFIDEVMQSLRRRLFVGDDRRIREYSGRGPLASWVRVVASRQAIDMARAGGRHPVREMDVAERIAAAEASPELQLVKETYLPAFQAALSAAIGDLSARERTLLRMSVLDGLSIDEIAVPYGVHRATAARWLTAIRERIWKSVRERVAAEHPGLRESDLSSLSRALDSQIHLSLSGLDDRPHSSDSSERPSR